MRPIEEVPNPVTMGSLVTWAREDDPEGFVRAECRYNVYEVAVNRLELRKRIGDDDLQVTGGNGSVAKFKSSKVGDGWVDLSSFQMCIGNNAISFLYPAAGFKSKLRSKNGEFDNMDITFQRVGTDTIHFDIPATSRHSLRGPFRIRIVATLEQGTSKLQSMSVVRADKVGSKNLVDKVLTESVPSIMFAGIKQHYLDKGLPNEVISLLRQESVVFCDPQFSVPVPEFNATGASSGGDITLQPVGDFESVLLDRLRQEGMADMWALGMHSYLAFGACPDFVVDLDDVFVALGLTCRDDAKALLVKHMTKGKDYITSLHRQSDDNHRTETISMTVLCFKKLCMASRTDNSMRVFECYSFMEALKLEMAEEQARIATAQLERGLAKTYCEVPKPEWVYICKEVAELAGDAHKIGRTIDTRKRESSLNCGSAQGAKMLYERATHNSKAVEDLVKAVMKHYHISSGGGTEHYRCNTEHSAAIIDASCIVVDTLASCYEAMPREEIFKLISLRMIEEGSKKWCAAPV
jgi:hypothetical protein